MQKWLNKRYEALWERFGKEPFGFDDAAGFLKGRIHESKDQVNVVLSELRKRGLVAVRFDPDDARKRIYTLKSRADLLFETVPVYKEQLTRGELETLLKKAADLIRTRVDYTFILVLLFYKRISDKWEMDYDNALKEAVKDGLSGPEAKKEAQGSMFHDFDIADEWLWNNLRKDPARLPENFSKAMKALAEDNPELRDIFENVDFVQFSNNRENAEILRQLVELFSARPLNHVSSDILGDAYEWLLRYFAPQKAKEGEVYTPREVIKLLVEILDPQPGDYVYDPAAGSAGMLIISYQHLDRTRADKLFLLGQEANYKTLALAKMNLYIHGIRNGQLLLGDTLLYPKYKDGEKLKTFDIVIANPPWNQDGYDEETLKKGEFWHERFKYGFTPRQSADWAWAQHMLALANDKKGRVGIVIDNGCLFRGGKERIIRSGVIKDDLLEAVILMPEKLFYNTGAPGAILFFNKNKPKERRGKILFINASKEFEQHPEVRKLNQLGTENQKKIVEAYGEFKETPGFSRVVPHEEIEKNDYNLNVTLYVFPEEEVEQIDIPKEWRELNGLDTEIAKISKKIAGYLKDLNYD